MQYLLFYQLEYWQILKIYPFSSIPLVKVYKKLVIHKKRSRFVGSFNYYLLTSLLQSLIWYCRRGVAPLSIVNQISWSSPQQSTHYDINRIN